MDNQTRLTVFGKLKKGKQAVALLVMIVCCVSIIAAGSLAFFTAEETNYNVITTKVLKVDLEEEDEDENPWEEPDPEEVEPGKDIAKVVYGFNSGDMESFVRIVVMKFFKGEEEEIKDLNCDYIELDVNLENWIAVESNKYDDTMIYYYKDMLMPGERTENLFTKVHFNEQMGNEYMGKTVVVRVLVQSQQARNNAETPLTADWPEF